MHELALCGSIADIIHRRAAGRSVETVRLRIGQLRQVVPDTLEYCWAMVTDSTTLAGSRLEIERVPAVLRCDVCSTSHALGAEIDFACPSCGGTATTVVSGEEFLVTSMDVASPAVEVVP